MSNESKIDFLNAEYISLWKEAGVNMENIATKSAKRSKKMPAAQKKAPAPLMTPPVADIAASNLTELRSFIGDCKRCGLCETRNQLVFGEGNPNARLMFVGEGPGADEDRTGRPFVGRAGQLLDKMIEAMGYRREEVYIANIVKCRPPGNRVPEPPEIGQCFPFVQKQIALIAPQAIVALGSTAICSLLDHKGPMSPLRGKWQKLPVAGGIPVMPTYHPAYLLRNPPAKKIVWDDLKLVMEKLKQTT